MPKPILLYTDIWSRSAEDFTNQILETPENESIDIWMNSPGGSVTAGWAMIAALSEHKNDVNISVMGDASSMAFFMLLFADNVTAYDTSTFLVHRAASWFEDMGEEFKKDIANRNKIIRKKLEARIDEKKFTEVTGKTFDDIFDMENRLDVRLTAKEAKKIGLVSKVIKLDVKKRTEIESRYFNDIAALAIPSTNSKSNKMGKSLKERIFGDKDSVLLASIGETQFVYSKIEKGEKIKATGAGDHEPISGTFEADDKKVTVVNNEITAVDEIDVGTKELDILKAEFEELKENQITVPEIKEVIDELQAKHKIEIDALKSDLKKAKITVSKPTLPEGEFKDDGVDGEEALTLREKLAAYQDEMHEDKIKTREV